MFVTFEGVEGAGKSSLIERLGEYLESRGQAVLLTREPGGCALGQSLRRILLDVATQDLAPEAELFLYLADRAQHVRQVIRPALAQGRVVLCDRYADSTIVYQGYGRGLDPELLFQLNDLAVAGLWPRLTVLLDLPAETGLSRARARNDAAQTSVSEGRFEAESLAFHGRVREGYLCWAARHADRFLRVDATLPLSEVFDRVRDALDALPGE